MKRILDDSLFEVFLRKNCEELLEEYRERVQSESCPLEERLENWFVLGYTCVLCKYSSVRTWLGLLENVNLGGNEDLETVRSIAVHFLGAHLDRMRLNFSKPLLAGSEHNLAEGFYQAVKTGRSVLAVLFLHLAGWHYAVLGMKEVSAALFSLGIRLVTFKNLHSIYTEFCQSGLNVLEGVDADPSWKGWTLYFYREFYMSMARFPLDGPSSKGFSGNRSGSFEQLFGHLSHESLLDALENDNMDRLPSQEDSGTNELLYAKLRLGRDISPDDLDADSFFVAGPAIDRYYSTKALQEQQRLQFVRVFDAYMDLEGFQFHFDRVPNLFRDAVSRRIHAFQERSTDLGEDMAQLILKMGCGTLYSRVSYGFNDPLRNAGVVNDRVMEFSERWVRESYENCLSNLCMLTDGQPKLPLDWRMNLLAHLAQRCKEPETRNSYAAALADCIRNSSRPVLLEEVQSLFVPYVHRLGHVEIETLLSHASIRSVGVEMYIDDPAYGRLLESFLSSFDGEEDVNKLGVYQFERLALHFDLLESEGWKGKTKLLEGREIYQIDSEDGSTIVFYFLAQEGEWKEINSGKRWELVSSPGFSIPSPVSALNDYVKNESDFSGREFIKVLVPFSNVTFSRPDVFLLKFKDVHVVPLKRLLALVGVSMESGSASFFQLLKKAIPDTDLLWNTSSRDKETAVWNFRYIIEFCLAHPSLRRDLKSDDVRSIEDVYTEVLDMGPVVLLRHFIEGFFRKFSLSDGTVRFMYGCALPDQPYSLMAEFLMEDMARLVDFRLDARSHQVSHSDDWYCHLNGSLLEMGFPSDNFFHKLLIIGPSGYLQEVYGEIEDAGHVLSRESVRETGKTVRTVERLFLSSVHQFQAAFKGWKGYQEELVAALQIRDFAEEAARTAIMARNMSHNLGSHVMAYIKHHLTSVSVMLRNKVFDQLFRNEGEFELLFTDPSQWKETVVRQQQISSAEYVTLPFLVGLGRFISYLQERQDFIANVATGYIPSCTTLNFKDFIYDELNPDKRYKRHSDRQGEKPDNILLGNIARSEGLMRETRPTSDSDAPHHDIILSFRQFDGEPVDIVPGNAEWDPSKYYGDSLKDAKNALASMREYSLSIPGGITGRHAFFSIVENIIRNASKHGNWLDKQALKITFDIFDANDYASRASENDNLTDELSLREVLRRYYAGATDGPSLYYITVTDNLDTPYSALSKLRQAINEEYVSSSGHMVETSKGIKEMRICSSWLRGFRKSIEEFSPVQFDERDSVWLNENMAWDSPAPVLYARLSHDSHQSEDMGHLQFIFAVRIPIRVLVVSSRFSDDNNLTREQQEFLLKNHWNGVSPEEFREKWAKLSYEFILLDDDREAIYKQVRAKSNSRLFLARDISGFSIERLLELDPIYLEDVLLQLWEKLSRYQDGEKITIDDQRAAEHYYVGGEAPEGMDAYVDVGEGIEYGPYIYRKHYESKPEFKDFQEYCELDGFSPLFIEGVSGGNSTDRIVRCEPIDKEWFFRQLHAMKVRVAIFDERLSNMVYGRDSSCFRLHSETEALVACKDYKGLLFAQKNVCIFNFVKVDDASFALYGLYRGTDELNMLDPNKPFCYCHLIGFLSKNRPFEFCDSYFKDFKFDRISIHQGLLDKLYDAFEIKDMTEKKLELTYSLYKSFMETDLSFAVGSGNQRFLPGMTIHSGRSKPSEHDMPQRIPYVPYASIEHAVQDCKYTLVDLLDSAIYE